MFLTPSLEPPTTFESVAEESLKYQAYVQKNISATSSWSQNVLIQHAYNSRNIEMQQKPA